MKASDIFRQLVWLINTLKRRGDMTLRQLSDKWIADGVADGNPLSRSTFNRHREEISAMFGLDIQCRAEGEHAYYISNPEVLKEGSVEHWLLSTLTVGGALQTSLALKDRIMLEDVPSGEDFLLKIIEGIRNNKKLSVSYKRFDRTETTSVMLAPYCLKLFSQRWYVLAHNGKHLTIYALDRMHSVELSDEAAGVPAGFDAASYFADYFGVLLDTTPVADVVVRAYGTTADYLRTLPLHHSQREVPTDSPDCSVFALHLCPTFDFVQRLLMQGPTLEVIEPKWLREQMKNRVEQMAELYRE